jgi:L-seryl-tRNA(Ser) seleniumtransferase
VTFSGDKLLGGPQAGLLVGKHEVIERIRRNPLKRALRCDKMTIAALEATLRLYRTSPDLPAVIPTLRALTRPLEEIEKIGQQTAALLRETLGSSYRIELVDSESEIGSGALPTQTLATKAVAVSHATIGPLEIAARFRNADPPIIGRVHKDRFLLDLRCVWNPHDIVPNERSNVRTFERSNDS